jgi:hypothetical protein
VIDLQIHWVPGHVDFTPNGKANKEAKRAAQGNSSEAKYSQNSCVNCCHSVFQCSDKAISTKSRRDGNANGNSHLEKMHLSPLTTLLPPKITCASFLLALPAALRTCQP